MTSSPTACSPNPLVLAAAILLASTAVANAIHPAPNGRIAYLETCATPSSLQLIAPDGSGKAAAPFAGIAPVWSPDGTRVAYWSGGWIWVANADGTEAEMVAQGDNPSWSPDGLQLAIGCNQGVFPGSDICRVDVTTHQVFNLTNDAVVGVGGTTRFSISPSWSPDPANARIAFYRSESNGFANTAARGIYTVGRNGGAIVPVAIDSGSINRISGYRSYDPDWSPDGTRIVLQRQARIDPGQPDTPGNVEEFIAVTSESGLQRISPPFTSDDHDDYPAWSPDGTLIAFLSDRGEASGLSHLWVMGADGSDAHMVTADPACTTPAWEIPPQQLKLGPARLTIADWRDEAEHEFALSPPRATLYGETSVTVEVRAGGAGKPVTLRAEPRGGTAGPGSFGFSLEPDTVGPAVYPTTSGADGTVQLYFVTRNLHAEVVEGDPVVTGFRLTATVGDGEPKEAQLDVVDNRARILARYSVAQDYVPDGARSVWRDAFLPPLRGPLADLPGALLSAIVKPGNSPLGTWFCNTYQSRTLIFLNDIRHSDDGWLLNGLEYAPLQTQHTEHHFVALYPAAGEYADPRTRILDPWLPQTIAVYTWQEWVNFVDSFGQGANVIPDTLIHVKNPGTCMVQCRAETYVPPPYPALGGHYPYFPENADRPIALRYDGCLAIPNNWCSRHGLGEPVTAREVPGRTDHATVVIGSPVQFHVGFPDGRGFGWSDPETYVNDFTFEGTTAATNYAEPEGTQGWYVEVPPGRVFTLRTPALADGSMSVGVVGAADVVWGVYRDVPIVAGETVRIDVDLDAACPALALDSGDSVACELPPTSCAAVAACRDADPCTDDACVDGLCAFTPRAGVAGARCVCERPAPPQCEGQAVPRAVTRESAAACTLLAKADAASKPKLRRRLLAKAARQWSAAAKVARRRKTTKALTAGCVRALDTVLGEAATRTKGVTP